MLSSRRFIGLQLLINIHIHLWNFINSHAPVLSIHIYLWQLVCVTCCCSGNSHSSHSSWGFINLLFFYFLLDRNLSRFLQKLLIEFSSYKFKNFIIFISNLSLPYYFIHLIFCVFPFVCLSLFVSLSTGLRKLFYSVWGEKWFALSLALYSL